VIDDMTIVGSSDSPILLKFGNQLYDLNARYRNRAGQSAACKDRDVDAEHSDIFDPIIQRDAEAASALPLNHYRRAGGYLRSVPAE
jgi:DNA-binding FadR family transcriptional regulator